MRTSPQCVLGFSGTTPLAALCALHALLRVWEVVAVLLDSHAIININHVHSYKNIIPGCFCFWSVRKLFDDDDEQQLLNQ